MLPMREAILSDGNLHRRFKALLETHTHVDIATAWATGGEHLRALANATSRERRDVKVRAIVGTTGRATHPEALEELNKITVGELRIVPEGDRLFHPKLYLFEQHRNGIVTRLAWIGSANFTHRGFGNHSNANEEILLEVGPGERADALAAWFEERWDRYSMHSPVSEVIRQYREDWKRRPPDRHVQQIVLGPVSHRKDLLDDDRRPLTLEGYRQALVECEEILKHKGWGILSTQRRSYMTAISQRGDLLLGDTHWSDLDPTPKRQLKGGEHNSDLNWWGLMGRIRGKTWPTMCGLETEIRSLLETVEEADDEDFPDKAVDVMRELIDISYVKTATATLLLTLVRPDRLLSLNDRSREGLEALSRNPVKLGEPESYRDLLLWLYDQPWYADSPAADEDSARIWRLRAALVDAFVYDWS